MQITVIKKSLYSFIQEYFRRKLDREKERQGAETVTDTDRRSETGIGTGKLRDGIC